MSTCYFLFHVNILFGKLEFNFQLLGVPTWNLCVPIGTTQLYSLRLNLLVRASFLMLNNVAGVIVDEIRGMSSKLSFVQN